MFLTKQIPRSREQSITLQNAANPDSIQNHEKLVENKLLAEDGQSNHPQ